MNVEIDMTRYELVKNESGRQDCNGCAFRLSEGRCGAPDVDCVEFGDDYIFIKKEQP